VWDFDNDPAGTVRANLQSVASQTQRTVATATNQWNFTTDLALGTNDAANVFPMKLYVTNQTAAQALAQPCTIDDFNNLGNTDMPSTYVTIQRTNVTATTAVGDQYGLGLQTGWGINMVSADSVQAGMVVTGDRCRHCCECRQ
jgi:hypothetical protein